MNDPEKIPMLLEFLFGKNASMAMRTASPCLLAWSHAFETWVAELERTRHFKTPKRAKFIWQTFLNGCGKLPWEVTQEDVRAYVEGRVALGRARNTIKAEISILSKFYEWIACTGSDPQAKPDFNPASGVDKPKVVAHEHSQALSHTEAQILLDAFLRQGSVLSLRDHAFILIRLRVGRLHSELLELRWGQIETRAEGPWVRWNDGGADLLEYDAYAALLHYLRKSGRLDVLTPHSYVFVPMKPGRVTGEEAGDWNEVKIMDSDVFLLNLKRFGVVVGIPPERLNLHALRHTAIRRRVEAGASAQEIRAFMGGGRLSYVRDYLRKLPQPPEESLDPGKLEAAGAILRQPGHFTYEDALIHGDRAKRQPQDEVQAIIKEGLHGVRAELKMMRQLGRHLMRMALEAETDQEQEVLHEVVSKTSGRIAAMRKIDRQLAKFSKLGDPLADFQAFENLRAEKEGRPPEKVVFKSGDEDGEDDPWEGLEEEIASSRLVARKAYALAMGSGDPNLAAHHAEIFGVRCIRLARLEGSRLAEREDMQELLRERIEICIDQVMLELDIHL